MANPPVPKSTLLLGIFSRKERWGLSSRGWVAVALLMALTGGLYFSCIFPFLAVTQRVDARVLVVEGWVHDYAIRFATEEFKNGAYQRIFTTGGPVQGMGGYTNDYNTSASVAAERLVAAGIPAGLVRMIPSHVNDRERTYSSALALRDWLNQNHVSVGAINIVTEDLHARRTRMLFQLALGSEVSVGIIAVPNMDYNPHRWWLYSEGVQEVFRECLAYLYAKFLFFPSTRSNSENSLGKIEFRKTGRAGDAYSSQQYIGRETTV